MKSVAGLARIKSLLYFILSIPVLLFLYIYTFTLIFFALIFIFLRSDGIVKRLIKFWTRSVFWFMGKHLKVEGYQHIDPGKHYILLTNHASMFDITAIMFIHPRVIWFGRERLLKVPLFGLFLRKLNYVPMKSGTIRNTKSMLHQLLEKSQGSTVAIFPEGTRTKTGDIQRFHRGFVHLLRSSQTDILPVTLNGFYGLKPKNRFYIDFSSRIQAVVHPSIPWESLREKGDEEIVKMVKEKIESAYTHPTFTMNG